MKKSSVLIFISTTILLVLAGYYSFNYLTNLGNQKILNLIDLQISREEVSLRKIADLTRQNGTDEVTSRIVVDCQSSDRQKFDILLDKLSVNISEEELNELEALFYKCGSFYADSKAVMALVLIREINSYSGYLNLRNNFISTSEETTRLLAGWNKLAESELKNAEYFNQLVNLQGRIITQLRSGSASDSEIVKETLNEVGTTRGKMLGLNQQIETIRKEELHI